jgi:periplasmic protein TonB
VTDDSLRMPFLSSVAIHICVLLIGSFIFRSNHLRQQDFLPIGLVDLPRPENPPPPKKVEAPPEIKKPPAAPPKNIEQPKKSPPLARAEVVKAEQPPPPLPVPAREEKVAEAKPAASAQTEAPPSFSSGAHVEGGGSEAGAGNPFGRGDAGVIPGTGTAGGGGGTASSGLGRGSGAPGLPAQTAPIKTNRQAKPIQTVRASYPPIALRAGLESDVMLRIEVDAEGKVTEAEITKSGGAGFDEEALKAVKQSRFEPAQKDGQNVAAEFTYIYRFRLRK